MTPTQRAIKEDLEAYEAMEEKLRKIIAAFNNPEDRITLIGYVRRYHRVLMIISQLQEQLK